MPLLKQLSSLTIAAVFISAGIAKLSSIGRTRNSFVAFGMHPHLAHASAGLVPAAEIVVGVAVMHRRSAPWAYRSVLTLLTIFSTLIARNVSVGRVADCPCFGQHFQSLSGPLALWRNVVLASVAYCGMHLVEEREASAPIGRRRYLHIFDGLVVTAAIGLALAGETCKIVKKRSLRNSTLKVGTIIPEGVMSTLAHSDRAGESVLAIFVQPGCMPCHDALESLRSLPGAGSLAERCVLVAPGEPNLNLEMTEEFTEFRWEFDVDGKISKAMLVMATPSAVLVRRDGRVESAMAVGKDGVLNLAHQPT